MAQASPDSDVVLQMTTLPKAKQSPEPQDGTGGDGRQQGSTSGEIQVQAHRPDRAGLQEETNALEQRGR